MMEDPEVTCPVCGAVCRKHIGVAHIDSYWDGSTYEDVRYRRDLD